MALILLELKLLNRLEFVNISPTESKDTVSPEMIDLKNPTQAVVGLCSECRFAWFCLL